jgi:glutamine synthetase
MRRETVLTLEKMGIPVEYSHHEVAPSQHEIDLRYSDALSMADSVMTYRTVVKQVAMKHGVYATFMPKPVNGLNGSAMHTNQSLFEGDRNAFYDAEDPDLLSDVAKGYMGGLLKHAPEITVVTNQWVNSYKRLVPGYEAPVHVSWARRNRSDLIRVPEFKPGREDSTRIEYRAPDAACNPYLAFSAMLAAGLEGVEKRVTPPPKSDEDLTQLSDEERRTRGVVTLPRSLGDAIAMAENGQVLRKALGSRVFDTLIRNKKIEWEQYQAHVHEYELTRYLSTL